MTNKKNSFCFVKDSDNELRSCLYRLETIGLVKLNRQRLQQQNIYGYMWLLTDKGQQFIDSHKIFRELYDKANWLELCRSIEKHLNNKEYTIL